MRKHGAKIELFDNLKVRVGQAKLQELFTNKKSDAGVSGTSCVSEPAA